MLNGIFILTAIIGITVDSCRQAKKYFQRALALNQEILIQEYVEKDDNQPTHIRRGTLDSQTLLAFSSRYCHNRNLSSSFTQEGVHTMEQHNQPYSDIMTRSKFVEIDLNDDDDESNTTVCTHTDYSMVCTGNFECLNDLAETCI